MSATRVVLMLLRLAFVVQLVVGIAMWAGVWITLVGLHMAVGSLFVLLLWILAVMALVRRRAVGLAVVAMLWGALLAWFGMAQRGFMIGDAHWLIRVIHLAIAMVAMPMAERLSRSEAPAA